MGDGVSATSGAGAASSSAVGGVGATAGTSTGSGSSSAGTGSRPSALTAEDRDFISKSTDTYLPDLNDADRNKVKSEVGNYADTIKKLPLNDIDKQKSVVGQSINGSQDSDKNKRAMTSLFNDVIDHMKQDVQQGSFPGMNDFNSAMSTANAMTNTGNAP